MKLEQQVTNLELSKRLKELGVRQESLFWWEHPDMEWGHTDWIVKYGDSNPVYKISAFTVAELLFLLDKAETTIPRVEIKNAANYLAEKLCLKLEQI